MTLLTLASDIKKLDRKDPINGIANIARRVYLELYANRDDATPDLPSNLKCKLLLNTKTTERLTQM
jgi:hypothetical protein